MLTIGTLPDSFIGLGHEEVRFLTGKARLAEETPNVHTAVQARLHNTACFAWGADEEEEGAHFFSADRGMKCSIFDTALSLIVAICHYSLLGFLYK